MVEALRAVKKVIDMQEKLLNRKLIEKIKKGDKVNHRFKGEISPPKELWSTKMKEYAPEGRIFTLYEEFTIQAA